jgi:hypothetical protein
MMKDPRLAILFPIWRETMDHPICVLVWREPAAVARSLARRDDLPFVLGLALWEEYTRAMLASTAGLPRVAVSYQELIADPIATVARLHVALVAAGAADLRLPTEAELLAMIDPGLDRHPADDEGLLNKPQAELRDALRSGAALDWTMVPPVQRETHELFSAFRQQWRDNEALRRTSRDRATMIDAIFASRSWRLGFAITRLWRTLARSSEPTAVERWRNRD